MTSTSSPIRILLVDDHAIVREGYRSLLQKQDNLSVVAEATDGQEAYQQFKTHQPDVVIMDITMPKQGGLEAITRIRQYDATAKIVVFSMHQNPNFAIKATKAGALGYVTKSSEPESLVRAIYDVHNNKPYLSSDIAHALTLEKLGKDRSLLAQLTVREFEVLRMLVEAKSTQAIAETLNISPKTVANTHYMIKKKLNVSSDIELTHLAIKLEILDQATLSAS
jgi:DNA-binding NarL/FixJ family response regulator